MKKQNVVLKIAIGLVLGIGALIFAPSAAQASTPCTPYVAPANTPPCHGLPNEECIPNLGESLDIDYCQDPTGSCKLDTKYHFSQRGYTCTVILDTGDPFTFDCQERTYSIVGSC